MITDLLSEALRSIHIHGTTFYHVGFGDEWGISTGGMRELGNAIIPAAEYVMQYHVMLQGCGWITIDGEAPVRLSPGDIVILPHGDKHTLSSTPGFRSVKFDPEWRSVARACVPTEATDGLIHRTFSFVAPSSAPSNCVALGFLGCKLPSCRGLIATLPRMLHLPASQENSWAGQLIEQAINLSLNMRPGGQILVDRISELVFVDAIRRHVDRLPEASARWMDGMADRQVGRALALIHEHPAHAWTIEMLAREVALSRSAFYSRFTRLIGQAPMQYLTNWRLGVATTLLRQSRDTVATVALDVGYDSEAAFARAFKRKFGMPPARWRKDQHSASTGTVTNQVHFGKLSAESLRLKEYAVVHPKAMSRPRILGSEPCAFA